MAQKSIPHHKLGKHGPHVPAIGFGLLGMSVTAYGSITDDEARFKLLDRALELGCTFWDTSDSYGDSETLLSKWFKHTGARDKIFLATKFGFLPVDHPPMKYDTSAKYCREACEKSLKKLGIDCIDLYYVHHVDTETPIEETMRELVKLQAEGKIKYIGLSNVSSECLRRAIKIAHVAAVQIEYGPFTLEIERIDGTNLLQTCRELGVAVVCYSPLGRGLVTTTFKDGEFGGGPTDMRAQIFPRLHQENRMTNIQVVKDFAVLAEKKQCTVSQLALAWLVKQGEDIIPIPGTKKVAFLEENWNALDVALTEADERDIRAFVDGSGLLGGQLPDRFGTRFLDSKAEERQVAPQSPDNHDG